MLDTRSIIIIVIAVAITLGFVALMYRLQDRDPETARDVGEAAGCLTEILRFFGGR